MLCPRCGNANPVQQKFCGTCGFELPTRAPLTDDLRTQLVTLAERDILREQTRVPELEYIFRHALTQEAAYQSLLLHQRKDFHRRVGEALEQLFADRLDEYAPMLAQHFFCAEDWQRAVTYAMRAGAKAGSVYALREAAAQYAQAVEALERWDAAPPTLLCDATLRWVQFAFRFARYEALVARLDAAERIVRELNDLPRLTQVLHWIGTVNLNANFNYRAVPAMMEWFRLAADNSDEKLAVVPSYWWAFFMVDRDPRAALEQFEHIIEAAHKYGDKEIEAHALATKALAYARLGDFVRARSEIQQALDFVRGINSQVKEADVNNLAGYTYLEMGDMPRALAYAQVGADKALAARAPDCASAGLFCVGLANLQSQNFGEARRAFDQTISLAEYSGAGPFKNLGQGALAALRLFGGQRDALADLEQARVNAQLIDDPYGEAMFSQLLGENYIDTGDLARAEAYLTQSLDYYRSGAMRPAIARALQSLARLYERQGRAAEAQQARAEAETLVSQPIEEHAI